MAVKCAVVGDIVQHYDGCTGKVVEGSTFVFDCGIPISRVDDAVDGHIYSDHPIKCKITTGSSVVFIDGKPAAIDGSAVCCNGYVVAGAQVVYAD